jgi:tetratricopeptide (TPR) repeat protein
MPTAEYILPKDREDISAAINNLLAGAAKLWFQGFPAEIPALIDPTEYGGRIPISVINLQHLSFQDQAYVVGYIAYLIWFWMMRQEGTERPRLLFYIDEIGGGGGKQAFFPSVAISPAKPALNLLLRQGRSQGVCCLFATQNPGDIDYKGLSNCGTWAVGQLKTKRDRSKIEQGAGDADLDFQAAKRFIPSLNTGQFVLTSPSQTWNVIKERWLYGYHRTLSHDGLKKLKMGYEQQAQALMEKSDKETERGRNDSAVKILDTLVRQYRFSSLCSRAYLMMGKLYYDVQKYKRAIENLKMISERFFDAEEAGEAQLLIGKSYEKQGYYEEAAKAFAEVSNTSANEMVRHQAYLHEELCDIHITWPKLSKLKQAILWIKGQRPGEQSLAKLEVKDEEIITEVLEAILPPEEFDIPDPVDYEVLLELKGEVKAEMLQLERWAQEQGRKIEEFLKLGQLREAYNLAQRIIQRLVDSGCPVPNSVYNALRNYNERRLQEQEIIRARIIGLEAKQFEHEVAMWMTRAGYQARVTQPSHDGGVDVLATRNGEKIVVQCKRWDRPVGPDKVRELAGSRSDWKADRALLVTTSDFTKAAVDTAQRLDIELWNFETLRKNLQQV